MVHMRLSTERLMIPISYRERSWLCGCWPP